MIFIKMIIEKITPLVTISSELSSIGGFEAKNIVPTIKKYTRIILVMQAPTAAIIQNLIGLLWDKIFLVASSSIWSAATTALYGQKWPF